MNSNQTNNCRLSFFLFNHVTYGKWLLLTRVSRRGGVDGQWTHGFTWSGRPLSLRQHACLRTAARRDSAVLWLVGWNSVRYSHTSHTTLHWNPIFRKKFVQVHILGKVKNIVKLARNNYLFTERSHGQFNALTENSGLSCQVTELIIEKITNWS